MANLVYCHENTYRCPMGERGHTIELQPERSASSDRRHIRTATNPEPKRDA